MKNYLVRLFISKNVVNGECGLSALEVPWLFFAQFHFTHQWQNTLNLKKEAPSAAPTQFPTP